MGHGKETPRQKMIGMMYLVLTALLALNVSAEILNAFVLVDTSLTKSGENFAKKNDKVYTEFEKAYQEHKEKVKPYKDKADQVKLKSQELFDYMKSIKLEIVKKADKKTDEYEKLGPKAVLAKDDNNIPGEIMILKNRGLELKTKLDTYREFLLSLIENKEKYKSVVEDLTGILNTEDMEAHGEGGTVPWQIGNFDHIPLSAVLTMLSKMQTDVRNSEADVLAYLYNQIDASSFKFNKLQAIVNAPSSYVIVGGKYTAEVFLAASDSTVQPDIVLNNGTKLDIKEGKGQFSATGGAVGFSKWGGIIKLVSPASGELLQFPFNAEYQVGAPSLVVSPTKMNVFYIGVVNPVDISVSGVPDDKLKVSISDGSIAKESGSSYGVKVMKPGKVTISVSAEFDKQTRDMGKKEFRVKRIPDPVAKVADMTGGVIQKNLLIAQTGVAAVLDNFDFDLKFKVTKFTVSTTIKGYTVDESSASYSLTQKQKDLIRDITSSKKVYFENIKAIGPDGTERSLPTIAFKIQ